MRQRGRLRRFWHWFTGRSRRGPYRNAVDVGIQQRADRLPDLYARVEAYEEQVRVMRALHNGHEGNADHGHD
ncbi:MAG TPA: hypothetical protein PK478_02060 [Nitrospira sp.]|nr:hypothetical protein [Nitrospira sp.]